MNYKKGSFTKYINEIKKRVDTGDITKEEATYFVLAKVATIFEEISQSSKQISNEQFMKEQHLLALPN